MLGPAEQVAGGFSLMQFAKGDILDLPADSKSPAGTYEVKSLVFRDAAGTAKPDDPGHGELVGYLLQRDGDTLWYALPIESIDHFSVQKILAH